MFLISPHTKSLVHSLILNNILNWKKLCNQPVNRYRYFADISPMRSCEFIKVVFGLMFVVFSVSTAKKNEWTILIIYLASRHTLSISRDGFVLITQNLEVAAKLISKCRAYRF